MNYFYYDTPVGRITLAEKDGFITQLLFGENPLDGTFAESEILSETVKQLDEYFSGSEKAFPFP